MATESSGFWRNCLASSSGEIGAEGREFEESDGRPPQPTRWKQATHSTVTTSILGMLASPVSGTLAQGSGTGCHYLIPATVTWLPRAYWSNPPTNSRDPRTG